MTAECQLEIRVTPDETVLASKFIADGVPKINEILKAYSGTYQPLWLRLIQQVAPVPPVKG